jgi:hypothetical protein
LKVDIPAILVRQFLLTLAGVVFYGTVLICGLPIPLWQKGLAASVGLAAVGWIALRPQVRGDIGYLWNLVGRGVSSRR